MMYCGHYCNQFKEEDVDFDVWRAFTKLIDKSIVAIDKRKG